MKKTSIIRLLLFLSLVQLLFAAPAAAKVDADLIGKWGKGTSVSYEFRSDGTVTYEGAATYSYDADGGVWHYWFEVDKKSAVAAEYKLSTDRNTLQINMKSGKKLRTFARIK
jgi:hypothetical protein